MAAGSSKVRTGIVLQGGGALGAFEFGVLKALYEQRPGFTPTVVTGTSIGAVTAAVLAGARGDPMEALDRLWREKLPVPPASLGYLDPTPWWPPQARRALAMAGNPGMYRPRADFFLAPWLCTSVYDTAPLRRTLDELVDLDRLNAGSTHVVVTAIDLETGEGRDFHSSPEGLSFDAIVASASLPPAFPMTAVQGGSYWDGGLFANTPLSSAINVLEGCEPKDRSIVRELIVVELFPMREPVPRNLPGVVERMEHLRYTSRLTLDMKFFDKIAKQVELLDQLEATLPPDSPVLQHETFKDLRRHRRVDTPRVVTADLPADLSNAADFSLASIEARIQAGYDGALRNGIGAVPVRA
jgi:NTE family protein